MKLIFYTALAVLMMSCGNSLTEKAIKNGWTKYKVDSLRITYKVIGIEQKVDIKDQYLDCIVNNIIENYSPQDLTDTLYIPKLLQIPTECIEKLQK